MIDSAADLEAVIDSIEGKARPRRAALTGQAWRSLVQTVQPGREPNTDKVRHPFARRDQFSHGGMGSTGVR